MAEEIKIVVKQETQGTALKDAARDAEALEKARPAPVIRDSAAMAASGGSAPGESVRKNVDYVALREQRRQAADFMAREAKGGKGGGEALDERAIARQAAFATRLEAKAAAAGGDSAGAAALEREAKVLERSVAIQKTMNVSMAEARVLAGQQVDLERQIAAQKTAQTQAAKQQRAEAQQARAATREQAAQERALAREQQRRESGLLQGGRMVLNAGGGMVGLGSTGFGSVAGAGGVAAVALGLAAKVAAMSAEQDHQLELIRLGGQAASAVNNRRLQRLAGYEGSDASAHGAALAARDAVVQGEAQRGVLAEEAKFRWMKPSTWLPALTGSNQNASIQNEQEIAENMRVMAEADRIGREKFAREGGGKELEMMRKMASASSADRRGVLAVQDTISWWEKYNEMKGKHATEVEAQEAANTQVFLNQRARAGSFGRLVNARSGAGDSARAVSASFIAEGRSGDGVKRALEELHETTKTQFTRREWAELVPRMNFRAPTRRLQ